VSSPSITLGTRRWDHLLPLTLGEVDDPSVSVRHERFRLTPTPAELQRLDVAERSLAQMMLAAGQDEWIALPAFPLSSFRHRCLIVRQESRLARLEDLPGATIGLTGWADTGNVWTKSLLADAKVELSSVRWRVGPLELGEPERPRLTHFTGDLDVRPIAEGQSLVDLLRAGELDAVMTPSLPAGFHRPDSPFRHLLKDFRQHEENYFNEHGFIPGIHVLAMRRESAERWPWLASTVVGLVDRSFRAWQADRLALVDTTPWLVDEFTAIGRNMGLDWTPYDPPWTSLMMSRLGSAYAGQAIEPLPAPAGDLFGDYGQLLAMWA
jgi:4,5-dihydroxyphthalate decarboxylase